MKRSTKVNGKKNSGKIREARMPSKSRVLWAMTSERNFQWFRGAGSRLRLKMARSPEPVGGLHPLLERPHNRGAYRGVRGEMRSPGCMYAGLVRVRYVLDEISARAGPECQVTMPKTWPGKVNAHGDTRAGLYGVCPRKTLFSLPWELRNFIVDEIISIMSV